MKLTKAEVIQIAKLARIALTPQEVTKYQSDFAVILGYVEKLNSLDTSQAETTAQVTGKTNTLRDDTVTESLASESWIGQAPARDGTAIKVRAVFGGNDG